MDVSFLDLPQEQTNDFHQEVLHSEQFALPLTHVRFF